MPKLYLESLVDLIDEDIIKSKRFNLEIELSDYEFNMIDQDEIEIFRIIHEYLKNLDN